MLGVPIRTTLFKGDIHISAKEKSWYSQVHEITGEDSRFWIIVAGGKNDYTIKWWSHERWQEVVDHFRDRVTFVQVGEADHYHPALNGVIDLRGKTDLRQLVRLVYHADGVVCPVTSLMHLAAAIEYKRNRNAFRPCVVVAGGREPNHWEAYPGHQFLHTIGMLPCCSLGGCWRARTLPLGDGDEKDRPRALCQMVTGSLPKCMDMIRSADVIHAIEQYLNTCPWLRLQAHGDITTSKAKSCPF